MGMKISRTGMIFLRSISVLSIFAIIFLFAELNPLIGSARQKSENPYVQTQEPNFTRMREIEATEYNGVKLVPVSQQGNNAIQGIPEINRTIYRLAVTGLINKPLNLSYGELMKLPVYSEIAYMPCVEGWGFNAKWTGLRVTDLLNRTGLKNGAKYVVFMVLMDTPRLFH